MAHIHNVDSKIDTLVPDYIKITNQALKLFPRKVRDRAKIYFIDQKDFTYSGLCYENGVILIQVPTRWHKWGYYVHARVGRVTFDSLRQQISHMLLHELRHLEQFTICNTYHYEVDAELFAMAHRDSIVDGCKKKAA